VRSPRDGPSDVVLIARVLDGPNVRVMVVMCVPVVERLCQAVIRRIPVLKCLLSGARGCL
jgi:hypothetical protein